MTLRHLAPSERNQIRRIALAHGARQIMVFGSFARDVAGPASDLDLLVDIEPGRSLLDMIAMKQDIEDHLGIKVDVVTRRGVSPHLRDAILQEAVPL